MTQMNIPRDVTGAVTYGLPFSDSNYQITLPASTNKTLTVPAVDSYTNLLAIFSYTPGGSVWVSDGTSAMTLPGASFTATPGCLNPTVRSVKQGDTLNFISSDTATSVGVSFYGLT